MFNILNFLQYKFKTKNLKSARLCHKNSLSLTNTYTNTPTQTNTHTHTHTWRHAPALELLLPQQPQNLFPHMQQEPAQKQTIQNIKTQMVRICICVYVYAYVCVHVCMYMYVRMCACICVFVYVCMYMYVRENINRIHTWTGHVIHMEESRYTRWMIWIVEVYKFFFRWKHLYSYVW